MRSCPVPLCTDPVPEGKYAIFCVEHHFQLPAADTSFLFRLQIKCERTQDEEIRRHLQEQIPGYINQAVRKLTGDTGFSATVELAEAHARTRREWLCQLHAAQPTDRVHETPASSSYGGQP